MLLAQLVSNTVVYQNHKPMELIEPWFEEVYHEIEECSGHTGDFSRIVFMEADSMSRVLRAMDLSTSIKLGGTTTADTDFPNDTITVSLDAENFFIVMKHELGHHVYDIGGYPYGHHRSNGWAMCSDPNWNTGS